MQNLRALDRDAALNAKLGCVQIGAEFARPADTNPYAIGDGVNNSVTVPAPLIFTGACPVNGGSGSVISVQLSKSGPSVASASFRLYLFNVSPTMVNDNAAYNILYSERVGFQGYVDLVLEAEGTGAFKWQSCAISFQCAAADTRLFGLLVAKGAYTPISGETFYVEIDTAM